MIADTGLSVRQSNKWGEYLKNIGWDYKRFSSKAMIVFKDIGPWKVAKIQRSPHLNKTDIEEIDTFCKQNSVLYLKLEPSLGQEEKVLEAAHFGLSTVPLAVPSTLIIDLKKSEEDLWKEVSHSGKYCINRAKREKNYTKIIKNPTKEELRTHYNVCVETGKRKGFYIPPFKDFLARVEAWGEEGYLIGVCMEDGKLAGSKMYLCHEDKVLYVNGGTTEAGLHNKSGYLLLWDSILYFKKVGYKEFDLEGMDDDRFKFHTKDWGGFSHFKEKFGGKRVEFPYPRIKYYSKLLKFVSHFSIVKL